MLTQVLRVWRPKHREPATAELPASFQILAQGIAVLEATAHHRILCRNDADHGR